MKKLLGILALLLLLPACRQTGIAKLQENPVEAEAPEETDAYAELIASMPVAGVEGEAISPDGRFEVRVQGASGEYVSGVQPPEFLQIAGRKNGEVLWQDQGWLSQTALWSLESGFLALGRTARSWCSITHIKTKNWTSRDFALPDGSSIPEYAFLPDGEPESIELGTIWYPGHIKELPDYYELRVMDKENRVLWEDDAGIAHAGQNSLYALLLDGEDYLLQYVPSMGQGYGSYQYRIFSLDSAGEPVIYRENHVDFDINFGSPLHESFDIPEIAAFCGRPMDIWAKPRSW